MKRLWDKIRAKKKSIFCIGLTPIFIFTFLLLAIEVGIFLFPFDILQLEQKLSCSSSVFFDKEDRIIWAHVSEDDAWRMPINLDQSSDYFVKAIINTEDKRFWDHNGVDIASCIRAAKQLIHNRKVISGASTITMQLARLTQPEPKGIVAKMKQSFRALHLERIRSKEWILESYINVLPFGKNIEGIEAASFYYFGKEAKALNFYEATMLAAIPQNPNKLRPDKFPQKCLKRQRMITQQMIEATLAPHETNPNLFTPYVRDIYFPRYQKYENSFPHFTSIPECLSIPVKNTSHKYKTHFDAMVYRDVANCFLEDKHSNIGIGDKWNKSVVVIENSTGQIICEYGDLNPSVPFGFINTTRFHRSPGSALKPWIYLLAIRKGIIINNTKLSDNWNNPTSERISHDYKPNNYDHKMRDWVSASSALNQSLNIPAVKLLSQVTVESFTDILLDYGVLNNHFDSFDYGLSLALGSKEVRLIDLTMGYHRIFWESQHARNELNADSAKMLLSCLTERNFPGLIGKKVAWKTGTSNGHKDAWCFAISPKYTIGVWVGFKSRKSDPDLIGLHAAQPVALDILNNLELDTKFHTNQIPHWDLPLPKKEWVCLDTYKRATRSCPSKTQQQVCRGITLSQCTLHSSDTLTRSIQEEAGQNRKLEIASPAATHYVSFNKYESVTFSLKNNEKNLRKGYWFLNGEFIGSTESGRILKLNLPEGEYLASCMSDCGSTSKPVRFSIRKINSPVDFFPATTTP